MPPLTRGLFFTLVICSETVAFGGRALRSPDSLAGFKGWALGKGKGGERDDGMEGGKERDGHTQFLKHGCVLVVS